MKFRKKPIVIEAFQMGIDNIPDWFMNKVSSGDITLRSDAPDDCHIESRGEFKTWSEINTLEGTTECHTMSYVYVWIIEQKLSYFVFCFSW